MSGPFSASYSDTGTYGALRMSNNKPSHSRSRLGAAISTAQTRAYGWRRKAATVAVGCLAVFMGYHVMFGHNGVTAYEHKRQEAHALQMETEQLRRENDRLRGHVQRLQYDAGAIEHQAREELHYTRAGEVIYTLPADPKATQPAH